MADNRLGPLHIPLAFAEHAAVIQRAIPVKRSHRADVIYLTEPEVDALLAAADRGTWTGRRDHTLLLAVQTGLRAYELTTLDCGDVHLGTGAHVSCHGKGRKDRVTRLTAAPPARTLPPDRHPARVPRRSVAARAAAPPPEARVP